MSLWEGMLCPQTLHSKSSRDFFFHVVTPDRIPQFTIPALDTHKKHRHAGKGKGELVGAACRSCLDPAMKDDHNVPHSCSSCSNIGLTATAKATPDPTARAALPLPHLPMVTTPYGFVTLGQSPQVPSEEGLFFHSSSAYPGVAEVQPSWPVEPGCCRCPRVPVAGGGGCSRMGRSLRDHKKPSSQSTNHKDGGGSQARGTSAELPMPRRCASPLKDIQIMVVLESEEPEKRERRLLQVGSQRSSSTLQLPTGTSKKNLLQRILRRPLAHPQQLKPMNFTFH